MSKTVRSGIDILIERDFDVLQGVRVALLVNQAAVDRKYVHLIEHIASHSQKLVRIFAPEHGLWGGPQDMERVASDIEPRTGVPVVSLYDGTAEGLSPKEDQLKDIDVLVIDMPDIGSRYFTYAQTAALAMSVAGKIGKKVIVLDRPNPIGGKQIEGSPLKPEFRSFCGMLPVPQRHGLTLGELCMMYEGGFGPPGEAYPACRCELQILKVEGWKRDAYLDEAGGTWVIPSPNMPTLSTAIVYPGMCLLEGTNLSEGRGTTMPFKFAGAPFVDGFAWKDQTLREGLKLEGAVLRPVSFIPKFQKWAGKDCNGLQIHVTDRHAFEPLRWAMALISAAKKLYPAEFKWRTDTYEFIDHLPAIDLLYGSDRFRKTVDAGGDLSDLEPELGQFEQWFSGARSPYLLYS